MFGQGGQRFGGDLLGLAIAASFVAVDPLGWDAFGPLRFLVIPAAALLGSAVVFFATPDSFRLPPRGYVLVAAAFIGWVGVATLTSIDRWHAVVGTPDRHFGFVTWVLLAIVALAVGQLTDNGIDRLIVVIVFATAFVGAYSILELFDVGIVDRTFADGRVGGPLGQPAYLGAAMALAVPVCVGWTIDRTDLPSRVLGVVASVGGLFALLASQSRAAWVGVAIAALIAVGRNRRRLAAARRQLVVGLAAFIIVAGVATAVLTPLGSRAASLAQLDGIADSRTDEWAVATRAMAANPIVGTGPEGYRIVFGDHVDEAYAIEHGRSVITDRAHNSLLDVGVTTGVPGLLAYAALLAGILGVAGAALTADRARTVGLAVGVIAYIAAALFLFPVAEIEVVFVTCAAALAALSGRWSEVDVGSWGRGVVVVGAFGVAAAGVGTMIAGGLDVAADHRVAAAIDRLDDPAAADDAALAAADDARQLRPDSTRYDFIAARIALQTRSAVEAQRRLDDGLRRSPRDPAFLAEQADVALSLARGTRDPADISTAQELSRALAESDANNGGSHLRLGLVHAVAGLQDEALTSFERAATLMPRDGEPLFNQAVVLVELGRLDDARAAARMAADRDVNAQPAVERLLRDIDQLAARPPVDE